MLEPPTTKAPIKPGEFHIFVEGGEDSKINEFPHMVSEIRFCLVLIPIGSFGTPSHEWIKEEEK